MTIVKILRIEEKIPTTFAKKIAEKAEERAKKDSEFAANKWHEQLEMIYEEEYGDILEQDNIESWFIDE